MPIYEYQCSNTNCGIKLEQLQKVTDEPLKICPECHETSLNKLISAAGFRLKGGGWYETDFKSDKDKRKNLSSDNTGGLHACSSGACCAKAANSDCSKGQATSVNSNKNTSTE